MNLRQSRVADVRRACGVLVAFVSALWFVVTFSAHSYASETASVGPLRVTTSLPLSDRQKNFTWAGSTTSQGDAVLGSDVARTSFGLSGGGIKIGIISDSFNFMNGMDAGIASGDLPGPGNPYGFTSPVTILNDDLFPGNMDEGRAIAEVIHDLAPGAQLLFHSAFNNPQSSPGGSIAAAIDSLVAAGANIIIDDVFSIGSPTFQDGVAARAVNKAFASGVAYFSSAGNNSNNAYQGMFSATGINHDFDANLNEGGDTLLDIGTIPAGGSVIAGLWWDDAYASLGGTPTSDFQFGIYNMTDGVAEGGSAQNQLAGADPFEAFGFTNNNTTAKQYGLFVEHAGGDPNKLLKIQVFDRSIVDDDDTDSPTIGGHSAAAGALAIGATPFYNPDTAELFTSQGPTTILYDTDGNRLATPEIRSTPALTGIDGVNTSFFFADTAWDDDSFPNFFGTSAATPHVAAIAALVMERATQLGRFMTPAELYEILKHSTVDMGETGYDSITGYGRLDAMLAISSVSAPEPGAMTMLLLAAVSIGGIRVRIRK
ncbi:MAG: S8 family serine peptidase [Pirellulales bacterium]